MNPVLCECGCGQATPPARQTDSKKGWILGQPIRFIQFHHHRMLRPERRIDQVIRLKAKIKAVENGCLIWRGNITPSGYGVFWTTTGTNGAHRIAYELLRGEIPDGLTLDHLCRNRACVNPDHLEPVTIRENLRRAPTALSTINAAKTHCKRGHPFDEQNTYVFGDRFRQCKACARMHSRNYEKRKLMRRGA